jgi:hypothetical protein
MFRPSGDNWRPTGIHPLNGRPGGTRLPRVEIDAEMVVPGGHRYQFHRYSAYNRRSAISTNGSFLPPPFWKRSVG